MAAKLTNSKDYLWTLLTKMTYQEPSCRLQVSKFVATKIEFAIGGQCRS